MADTPGVVRVTATILEMATELRSALEEEGLVEVGGGEQAFLSVDDGDVVVVDLGSS
jgi:prefoldin subunit 5